VMLIAASRRDHLGVDLLSGSGDVNNARTLVLSG